MLTSIGLKTVDEAVAVVREVEQQWEASVEYDEVGTIDGVAVVNEVVVNEEVVVDDDGVTTLCERDEI